MTPDENKAAAGKEKLVKARVLSGKHYFQDPKDRKSLLPPAKAGDIIEVAPDIIDRHPGRLVAVGSDEDKAALASEDTAELQAEVERLREQNAALLAQAENAKAGADAINADTEAKGGKPPKSDKS